MQTIKSFLKLTVFSQALVLFCTTAISFSGVSAEPKQKNSINSESNFQSFYYLGGKLGINRYQDVCESWSVDCEHNDLALGFFGGYQLNEYIAFEAAYLKLGDATATYIETGVEQEYVGSMQGFELSALTTLNIFKGFSIFAKAGTFNWYGENTSHHGKLDSYSWAPTAGAGFSYQISKSWQARLEYQYFHELGNSKLGSTNAHLTTLGVSYRFGETKAPRKHKKITPTKQNTAKQVTKQAAPIPAVINTKIIAAESINILFAFDDSKLLTPNQLSSIINKLKKFPQAKVILTGHTDSTGDSQYNLELSKKRVNTIKEYLIAQGVNVEQIEADSFGEEKPIIDTPTTKHQYKNRRVEVYFSELKVDMKNDNQTKSGEQGAAQ